MKFLSATLLLGAPLLASAASVPKLLDPWQMPLQVDTQDKVSVPGENPLVYCGNPDSYTLKIDSVTLSPNPPKAYVCLLLMTLLWSLMQTY